MIFHDFNPFSFRELIRCWKTSTPKPMDTAVLPVQNRLNLREYHLSLNLRTRESQKIKEVFSIAHVLMLAQPSQTTRFFDPCNFKFFGTSNRWPGQGKSGVQVHCPWSPQKVLPSGKRLHNYGTSSFFMGNSTISMVIFNSKLLVITRGYGQHIWNKWAMAISMGGWPSLFWENISIHLVDEGQNLPLHSEVIKNPNNFASSLSLSLSLSWSSSIFVYCILCRSDINGLSWPSKQLPISADPSLIFSSTHLKILTCRYWDLLNQSPYVFLRIIHALSGILPPLLIQAITAARAGNEKLLQRNRYETLRYLQKRATSQSARSVSNWKNARTIENRWFSTALMLLGHGTATPVPWGWLMPAAWNHMNSTWNHTAKHPEHGKKSGTGNSLPLLRARHLSTITWGSGQHGLADGKLVGELCHRSDNGSNSQRWLWNKRHDTKWNPTGSNMKKTALISNQLTSFQHSLGQTRENKAVHHSTNQLWD